jgi:hypothetical protein
MSGDSETNEWNSLKTSLTCWVYNESPGSEDIEKIFDVEFRRRFAELINWATARNNETGYID